jgi:predicted PurR-regulated permease PerM
MPVPPPPGPPDATTPAGLVIPAQSAGLSPFGEQPRPPARLPRPPVPVRTIVTAIGLVLAALVMVRLVTRLHRMISWFAVAAVFAVVLSPLVDMIQRRWRVRRGVAVLFVVLTVMGLIAGLVALFVTPVATQAPQFWEDLPDNIAAAGQGRGPFADLVKSLNLEGFVRDHEVEIRRELQDLGSASTGTIRVIFGTLLAIITIITLTVLLLLQGPNLCSGVSSLLPERHRDRVSAVAADAARAVSHYMLGNLLISLIAGLSAFSAMLLLGVPNALVLALWIAFTDLIPLVGATAGAIPAVLVAALHSGRSALILAIFLLLYQQFENHVLQVVIMARTVKLNSLLVLVSVLVGIELFGVLGAFLAIPAAGALQVVVRDVWDARHGRPRASPVVTEPEGPVLPNWRRIPAVAAASRVRDSRRADRTPNGRHDLGG